MPLVKALSITKELIFPKQGIMVPDGVRGNRQGMQSIKSNITDLFVMRKDFSSAVSLEPEEVLHTHDY